MPGQRELARGLAAGFLGGLAGGVAMGLFSAAWARFAPASRGKPLQYPATPAAGRALRLVKGSSVLQASQQEWDSTESAAVAMVQAALQRELYPAQRVRAAVAVHFAIGAAAGALYGAAAEWLPSVKAASGAVFGFAVWMVAQELAMPVLGWSRPLTEYSTAMQANSLGEHLAYGIATEVIRRRLRELL